MNLGFAGSAFTTFTTATFVAFCSNLAARFVGGPIMPERGVVSSYCGGTLLAAVLGVTCCFACEKEGRETVNVVCLGVLERLALS